LPDELFCRNLRAEIACARAHVAVGQLEPRPGEGVCQLVRVLVEAPGDVFIDRVDLQGNVRGQHAGRTTLRRVVGIQHRAGATAILRLPLMCTGRALGQFPVEAEQVPEEVIAPLRWRLGPNDLQAAGDRVIALAGAEAALPAESLFLDGGGFGLRPHMGRWAGAVGFAERVTARYERHRLFVVHSNTRENLTDILGRQEGIRVAIRPFRVDVDQAHLYGRQG